MKVIVCGAGQVGSNIARHLSGEHNDVSIIDQSAELVQNLADTLDVQAIVGHASHPDILDRAGAANADMLIAVTYTDEVNMVACAVGHAMFNIPTKIARIRSQNYLRPQWSELFSDAHLPIDVVISPEIEVARAAARQLEVPGTTDIVTFCDGKVKLIGVRLTPECPIIETPLRQLTELFPELNIVVVGIVRDEKLMVPSGDSELAVGDEVFFAVATDQIDRALSVFGHEEKEARRIVIVGGGNVGLCLARELEEAHSGLNVKVIERNRERAEHIADILSRTVILHGDALDEGVMAEANIPDAEAIVAVSSDDETNVLASLLAKRAGCERAITLITNPSYSSLTPSLGVDVVLDPRANTVSTILQHVRRGKILGLRSIANAQAEVIEAEAMETSGLVGTPLRDIELPKGMIVGAILRGEEVIIPRGDTVIKAHDRVVILALAEQIKKVEKLFSVSLEYF